MAIQILCFADERIDQLEFKINRSLQREYTSWKLIDVKFSSFGFSLGDYAKIEYQAIVIIEE